MATGESAAARQDGEVQGQSVGVGVVGRRQRGASAIEYVIIAAVIALAIWAVADGAEIGAAFTGFFDTVKEALGTGSD